MIEQDADRNPVEVLAGEFAERYRTGEHPSLSEYVEKYPEWAEEIRDLFPSVVLIEQLKLEQSSSRTAVSLSKDIESLGDYRIVREIGRGGMGIVYEAKQESLGRHVALKVLPDGSLLAPKQLARFQREAQAAARLHHTNIVPVFGFGEQDGLHYYVMQFIDGRGLDEILNALTLLRTGRSGDPGASKSDARRTGGPDRGVSVTQLARALLSKETGSSASTPKTSPLVPQTDAFEVETESSFSTTPDVSIPEVAPFSHLAESPGGFQPGRHYWRSVASIGMQVARAIEYAHTQGILHRDVKPANLIMDRQGTVWVADFGLAKLADLDDLTHSGDMIGTLRYMAPERFSGRSDARSDLYSLGLTLYELLTHRPAFDALDRSRLIHQVTQHEPPRPRGLDPRIPRDLETIVLKAIAREPGHRYPTAGELAEDLECFLEDRPIRARRINTLERTWRWCRRNRAVSSLTAAALALLLLAAGVGMVGYLRTTQALHGESLERGRAETNLALAIEAFQDILGKLAPAASPEGIADAEAEEEVEPGFYPVVTQRDAALLESMLSFYDRFAEENATSAPLHRETAKAHRSLGDIQQRLGQFQQAEDAYRRAIALYAEIAVGATPQEACECRTEMAAIHNELGSVLAITGNMAEARDAHRNALELLDTAPQTGVTTARHRFELAQTHIALGKLLWHRKQMPERMQHHEQALALLNALVQERPTQPEYRLALGRTLRYQWWAFMQKPSCDNADDAMKKAVATLEQLVAEFPKDPDYRLELSKTYAMPAIHLSWSKQADSLPNRARHLREALNHSQFARDEAEKLVAGFPTVPQYFANLADIHRARGYVLGQMGREREAEEELSRALTEHQELVKQWASVPIHQVHLAKTRSWLSEMLSAREEYSEAQRILEDSIAELNAYFEANPDRRWGKRDLIGQYEELASLLSKQGKHAAAAEAARNAENLRPKRPRSRSKTML